MFESKKNNVWFNIGNQLTANTSSTLLTILGGKETLFGADFGINDITKHFKLTLTKFVGGVISISEVVKVTAKSGNSLTIVRAYEPCPLNANATVMTQSPQAFDVGDFAYMNITASDLIELGALIDTKQNNCVMLTKSANYTFTGAEANNTGFSTNTTSGNITYTINPALFPTTNGMYEFTIYKSTNDVNTVIIDVGAGKTIDTAQTYALTNYMETVTIRIASSIFVKVIATTNRMVVIAPLPTTQSTFVAGENITAGNALCYHPGETFTESNTITITSTTYNGTFSSVGQTYIATKTQITKITGVNIGINGTVQITPKLYSSVGGTLLGSGSPVTVTGSNINSYNFYTFTFTAPIDTTIGNTYYIYLENNTPATKFNATTGSNTYANGSCYYDANIILNGQDLTMNIFEKTKDTVAGYYKTNASNSSKINFIGFATNTVSSGGNVIVDTSGISATQSGLTAGSDYYLSNTPGAISTTPGTNVKYIGTAVSSTGIQIRDTGLNGTTGTTATTGSVTLGNAVGYVTTSVNGLTVKIPYYNV